MNSFFASGVVVPISFVFSRDSATEPCDDIALCTQLFFDAVCERDHEVLQRLCGEYYDDANLLEHWRRLLMDDNQRSSLLFVGQYEAWQGVQRIYVRSALFNVKKELLAVSFDLTLSPPRVQRFCQI